MDGVFAGDLVRDAVPAGVLVLVGDGSGFVSDGVCVVDAGMYVSAEE